MSYEIVEKSRDELVSLLQRMYENTEEEYLRRARSLTETSPQHVSPGYIQTCASEMTGHQAVLLKLAVLLRVAHGYDPNGGWPPKEGVCVFCGREAKEGDLRCHHYGCVKKRRERHEAG